MIVYLVKRQWFTEKEKAEAFRRQHGFKPAATFKVTVNNREELAALLNGLCEPQAVQTPPAPLPAAAVDTAYVKPGIDLPDYVPRFLLDEAGKREWDKLHLGS